jgi:outer membrane protein
MNVSTKTAIKLLAMACAMSVAAAASAQSKGELVVTAGAAQITPKVESGDVSAPALPGTKAAVGSNTQPVLIFTYGLSDNITTEFALGTPYKHKLYGDGAIAGTGQLGSVEVLPPTLFIQYRFFEPKALLRPYVGLGLTYSYFQKATGSAQLTAVINTGGPATTFKIDNKLAATVQLGAAYNINERWSASLAVTKTFVKTVVHYSTGQTSDMKLDPVALVVGVGYKF